MYGIISGPRRIWKRFTENVREITSNGKEKTDKEFSVTTKNRENIKKGRQVHNLGDSDRITDKSCCNQGGSVL